MPVPAIRTSGCATGSGDSGLRGTASRAHLMLPEWERLLSAAARLRRGALGDVLAGSAGDALHVGHRRSRDADHAFRDLRSRYDVVLAQLESVAGWETARTQKPVLILGSLDGVETGVRQLVRKEPLETTEIEVPGGQVTIPSHQGILRIKGVLALRRNATRDYLDFAALSDGLGRVRTARAFERFDLLYPQKSGQSALQQLLVQLANPRPHDLDERGVLEYRDLESRWHAWPAVTAACADAAATIFDHVCSLDT